MPESTTPPADPQVGRARDEGVTSRILETVLAHLEVETYASLKIERIAQDAATSKNAIYRRWPSKEELVAAAILTTVTPEPTDDVEPLEEALFEHHMHNTLVNVTTGELELTQRRWALLADPTVRTHLQNGYLNARRERGRAVLRAGIARGEIDAATDVDAVLDLLAGMAFYRALVRDEPTSPELLRSAIQAVIAKPPLTSGR